MRGGLGSGGICDRGCGYGRGGGIASGGAGGEWQGQAGEQGKAQKIVAVGHGGAVLSGDVYCVVNTG